MKLAKFQLTTMMFVPQLSQGIEAWNTKLERQCPSTRTEILLDLWQAYYQVFHWRKIIYNKKCIVSYCLLWFGHLVGKQKCLRLQRIHSVEHVDFSQSTIFLKDFPDWALYRYSQPGWFQMYWESGAPGLTDVWHHITVIRRLIIDITRLITVI